MMNIKDLIACDMCGVVFLKGSLDIVEDTIFTCKVYFCHLCENEIVDVDE